MGTKIHLQLEDIYSDPYGFTYSEVAETIGEEQEEELTRFQVTVSTLWKWDTQNMKCVIISHGMN